MQYPSRFSIFAAAMASAAIVSEVEAVVLLRDEFNASAPSDDVNFEINASGRQSGSLAGTTYVQGSGSFGATAGGGNDYQTQINNGRNGKLWLVGQGGTETSSVSPDHNFNENPGIGGYISIRIDINPDTGGPSADWAGITVGASDNSTFGGSGSGARGQFINNSAAHFGILFKDDGNYEVFDGSTGNLGTGNGSFALDGTSVATHQYELRISGLNDGNPWDGSGDALIEAFRDNNPTSFFSFTKVGGYTDNFISLQGFSAGFTIHEFDNLQVEVIPEPSSLACIGGALWVILLRRSRRP